jgi:hypothetical protein
MCAMDIAGLFVVAKPDALQLIPVWDLRNGEFDKILFILCF